jgi:hypothetical protein
MPTMLFSSSNSCGWSNATLISPGQQWQHGAAAPHVQSPPAAAAACTAPARSSLLCHTAPAAVARLAVIPRSPAALCLTPHHPRALGPADAPLLQRGWVVPPVQLLGPRQGSVWSGVSGVGRSPSVCGVGPLCLKPAAAAAARGREEQLHQALCAGCCMMGRKAAWQSAVSITIVQGYVSIADQHVAAIALLHCHDMTCMPD